MQFITLKTIARNKRKNKKKKQEKNQKCVFPSRINDFFKNTKKPKEKKEEIKKLQEIKVNYLKVYQANVLRANFLLPKRPDTILVTKQRPEIKFSLVFNKSLFYT